MLERWIRKKHALHRMRSGPVGEHLEDFAVFLCERGYREPYFYLRAAEHLGQWAARKRIRTIDLSERSIASFSSHPPGKCCPLRTRIDLKPGTLSGARLFLRHLKTTGVIPDLSSDAMTVWPVVDEFGHWMHNHRGVMKSTVAAYRPYVLECVEVLGIDPGAYDAREIRTFVINRASRLSTKTAGLVVTSLRMFFRYLAIRGYCSPDLVGVIPTIAHRRLASLPRHISEGDVERVIAACDPGTQRGLRNRAVLLLLARLGLRAGDVASLRLTDLDWKRGRIRLMGKARREVWLPLPQEAGDAILCYIDRGRPELDVERVFLTLRAPVRPLSPTGVSHAVRRAIRRAGVEAPVTGARILRHSFATALLRRGASLDAIGSILRHQNTETTAVYSKVNSTLLLDVAQPWPGKAVVHAE